MLNLKPIKAIRLQTLGLLVGMLTSTVGLAALPKTAAPMIPENVRAMWMSVFMVVLVIGVIAATYWLCRGLDKNGCPAVPKTDERDTLIWLIRRVEEIYATLVALKRMAAETPGQGNPYAATVREIGHIRTNLSLRLNHLAPPLAADQSPDSHAKPQVKETP